MEMQRQRQKLLNVKWLDINVGVTDEKLINFTMTTETNNSETISCKIAHTWENQVKKTAQMAD
jgi:hypothetical protein